MISQKAPRGYAPPVTELTTGERIQALLFLFLATATMAGLTLFLLGLPEEDDRKLFTVRFEGSVAGIAEKSGVMFQGVPCGEVLRIQATDGGTVRVTISVSQWTPVTRSTRAFIASHSIVGPFHIELKNDDPSAAEVQEGWVIPGKSSLLQTFLATGQTLTEKMLVILQNLERLTAEERQEQVFAAVDALTRTLETVDAEVKRLSPEAGRTMTSVRRTSDLTGDYLETHREEIDRLIVDLSRSAYSLRRFLEDGHLERISGEVSTEIAGAGDRLDRTLDHFDTWLDENAPGPFFERTTASMEELLASLSTLSGALESEGVALLRTEVSPLLSELRTVSRDLSLLLKILAIHPRALFFGDPAEEKPLPGREGRR